MKFNLHKKAEREKALEFSYEDRDDKGSFLKYLKGKDSVFFYKDSQVFFDSSFDLTFILKCSNILVFEQELYDQDEAYKEGGVEGLVFKAGKKRVFLANDDVGNWDYGEDYPFIPFHVLQKELGFKTLTSISGDNKFDVAEHKAAEELASLFNKGTLNLLEYTMENDSGSEYSIAFDYKGKNLRFNRVNIVGSLQYGWTLND